MDKVIGKAEIVKSTIKEFLELFRAKFDADVCYLYLVNKAMDDDEKLMYYKERKEIIKAAYKKRGEELPAYLIPQFKYDVKEDKDEILKSIDILKFIDVAKKKGIKGWDVNVENRPAKYVLFKKLRTEDIRGEGLTAYMARVKHARQFFNCHDDVKEHPSSAFSNHKNIAPNYCAMLIGFPLEDENGITIGVIKIENYSKCEYKNKDEKEYIRAENYSKCVFKYTGEYKYNSKDSNVVAVQSYIPLLVQFILSSEKAFNENSYESLFKGMGLLDNLKNMEFPVPVDKTDSPVSPTKKKLAYLDKNIRHDTNREIYNATLHLFLVLKRREFIGHDEILRRITHYVMAIGEKLGLNMEIIKYFQINLDQFQKHEELLLSGLDNYRDHFIHQFHVFVSGYIIINELGIENFKLSIQKSMNQILSLNNKSQNDKKCDNDEEYKILDADVLRIWFLTAFYHDFAYILEKLDTELEKFFDHLLGYSFNVKFNWEKLLTEEMGFSKHICDLLKFFMSKNGTSTDQLLQNYLNAIITSHDHGVLSALLLINSSKKVPYKNINECFYAALAISLHNYKVAKNLREGECISRAQSIGISFESFPIAFLLAFCDTAQSFGRLETKNGLEAAKYPTQFIGIDILENEKVTYKIEYIDQNKSPDTGKIKEWDKVNEIFRSLEYSFVIEYYKPKYNHKLEEKDLRTEVIELICAEKELICAEKEPAEKELICAISF